MSRLIFLNLPPTITEQSFRKTLTSAKSVDEASVTDVKLITRRRFAFVGFKSDEGAQKAKEWFDGTFAFGGGKVKVDSVRDEPLSTKPAKKPRIASKTPPAGDEQPKAGSSKQLEEFMNVMKGVDPAIPEPSGSGTAAVPGDKHWKDPTNKSAEVKKSRKGKEKSLEPEDEEQVDEEDDDAAWLRKRQKAQLEGEDDAADNVDASSHLNLNPNEALILSTGRLFVRNLPFSATSDDLSSKFSSYGHVESVHVPVAHSGEPLGTAFILFRDPAHALEAYKSLDKTTFQGRLLHVLPGRARPGQENQVHNQSLGLEGEDGVLGKVREGRGEVKSKTDQKRKDASSKGVNWATLYMNSDAVAASVADRMGVSKSDLLSSDPSESSLSPAVKLALAETHVIAETKQYFADAGLNIDSLQPRTPRSQTIILVKNIPYGTTINTLTDLFSPYGKIVRLLLPPAGTIGVVEYESAADTSRAFKALAYKRLGSTVLYLEKGPQGMFNSAQNSETVRGSDEEARALAEKVSKAETNRERAEEGDEAGSTLFLKGLSFSTTTDRLQKLLSPLPGYSFARVQTKPAPQGQGERQSMGYGFVGFKTRDAARKAMAGLENFEIDGKTLDVKFAQRGSDDNTEKKSGTELNGKTKSTKVLVKNLPFEASKKDIRELFSAYGSLKALRLPKKSLPTASGSHSSRGFAFVEFTTHAEAARAMEALRHTHLLGRHLVLQWMEDGDGVDVNALREKVSKDWRSGMKRGGKRKLDFGPKEGEDVDE